MSTLEITVGLKGQFVAEEIKERLKVILPLSSQLMLSGNTIYIRCQVKQDSRDNLMEKIKTALQGE